MGKGIHLLIKSFYEIRLTIKLYLGIESFKFLCPYILDLLISIQMISDNRS